MKISTKGKYGLEALLYITIHEAEGHISIMKISEELGISDNYLEQIFVVLRRNGFVQSIRGAQGGYKLAKHASLITVAEIIEALEGSMAPVECLINEEIDRCERFEKCATRILWERVMNELYAVTNRVTLASLVVSYEKEWAGENLEYYI